MVAVEEDLLSSSSTVKEVSAKVNLLKTVHFVAYSWQVICSKTIQNCFAHYGFKASLEIPDVTNSEDDTIFGSATLCQK